MNLVAQEIVLSLVMAFFVWRAIKQLFPATYRRLLSRLSPHTAAAETKSDCSSGCGPCSGCGSTGGTGSRPPDGTGSKVLSFHPAAPRARITGGAPPSGQGSVKDD